MIDFETGLGGPEVAPGRLVLAAFDEAANIFEGGYTPTLIDVYQNQTEFFSLTRTRLDSYIYSDTSPVSYEDDYVMLDDAIVTY